MNEVFEAKRARDALLRQEAETPALRDNPEWQRAKALAEEMVQRAVRGDPRPVTGNWGHLVFVGSVALGRIHVGFSRVGIEKHFADTQIGQPAPLRLFGACPMLEGGVTVLLSKLAFSHLADGWHDLTDDLLSEIAVMCWFAGSHDCKVGMTPPWISDRGGKK